MKSLLKGIFLVHEMAHFHPSIGTLSLSPRFPSDHNSGLEEDCCCSLETDCNMLVDCCSVLANHESLLQEDICCRHRLSGHTVYHWGEVPIDLGAGCYSIRLGHVDAVHKVIVLVVEAPSNLEEGNWG